MLTLSSGKKVIEGQISSLKCLRINLFLIISICLKTNNTKSFYELYNWSEQYVDVEIPRGRIGINYLSKFV